MDAALAETVTLSSRWMTPESIASIKSSNVMTFVTDAGGMDSSAFCV